MQIEYALEDVLRSSELRGRRGVVEQRQLQMIDRVAADQMSARFDLARDLGLLALHAVASGDAPSGQEERRLDAGGVQAIEQQRGRATVRSIVEREEDQPVKSLTLDDAAAAVSCRCPMRGRCDRRLFDLLRRDRARRGLGRVHALGCEQWS